VPDCADPRLLLLTPSTGFGGGIERMADAVEANWPGRVVRVNLYRPNEVRVPSGDLRAKLRFSRRALLVALRERPHTVLLLHVNFLAIGLLIKALMRARIGLFAIGVEVWSPLSRRTRYAVRRCDWLLAISSFTADWFARRAGVESSRVRVIRLPIDQRLAMAAARDPGRAQAVDSNGFSLLTVSRLVPEHRFKGCFTIARALPIVLAERPAVRWTLVGHGSDLELIRAECTALGIEDAVEFTGRIGDDVLAEKYRRADAFVLPSSADPDASPPIGEGFGLVFAEAGAFGVPSVGSSAGGGSLEIVINGETGLTVPPDDPPALARAILRLVDDDDLRRRLGQGARKLVESRHLPSQFARECAKLATDSLRRSASASTGTDGLPDDQMAEPR